MRSVDSKGIFKQMWENVTLQQEIEFHKQRGEEEIAEHLASGNFSGIPSYCPTRWWGNHKLISRIEQHYSLLKNFFASEKFADENILALLNNPFTITYIQFLKVFLGKTMRLIELFQQDKAFLLQA
jgi:hypothetical protein